MMSSGFVVVGKIKCPHGLSGETEVIPQTDYPSRFKSSEKLYLAPPLSYDQLTIEKVTFIGQRMIVKFREVSSLEQAEELRGCLLEIPPEKRVRLARDSFWISDIIDMDVFLINGHYLGKIKEVIRTGSNDVYAVETDKTGFKDILIPGVKDVVKEIDVKNNRMVIEPMPGLLPEED